MILQTYKLQFQHPCRHSDNQIPRLFLTAHRKKEKQENFSKKILLKKFTYLSNVQFIPPRVSFLKFKTLNFIFPIYQKNKKKIQNFTSKISYGQVVSKLSSIPKHSSSKKVGWFCSESSDQTKAKRLFQKSNPTRSLKCMSLHKHKTVLIKLLKIFLSPKNQLWKTLKKLS